MGIAENLSNVNLRFQDLSRAFDSVHPKSVADPGGVDPDPDPTFEKKLDLVPTIEIKPENNPDPDLP